MTLKWKKAIWWRDEEDGKLYIHPILAFAIIIASPIALWVLLSLFK